MAAIHEFVRLIVRDYLTSNGLDDTLEMFLQDCERKKWKNPDPEHWYQLTEALDLPEMMQDYGNEGSIISVLVKYLVKNRQKKVIPIPLVKKMEAKKGTMRLSKSQPALDLPPRPQTAPESSILTKHGPVCKETRPQKSLKKQGQRGKSSSNKLKSRNRPQTGILRTRSPVRDLDRPDLSHIPQKQKDRMFNRELQNVRDTLIARENTSRRRQMLSTRLRVEAGLEEARNDSYQKKNVKCMLCTQSFRPHQLKGRASYKSIMDIRSIWKPTMPELNPVLAKPPRCYDKVKVCVFCAQFVGNVEAYRPTFAEKKRQERLEAKRRNDELEREANRLDPLQDQFDEIFISETASHEEVEPQQETQEITKQRRYTGHSARALAGARLHYSTLRIDSARHLDSREWRQLTDG